MPQVNLDPKTYATIKAIAQRDDRLLKGVVRAAVEGFYGGAVQAGEEVANDEA